MPIKTIPLSRLESDLKKTLDDCARIASEGRNVGPDQFF